MDDRKSVEGAGASRLVWLEELLDLLHSRGVRKFHRDGLEIELGPPPPPTPRKLTLEEREREAANDRERLRFRSSI